MYFTAPLYDCDCGARADLHLYIFIQTMAFACQLDKAVGLQGVINNGWPNHSLAKDTQINTYGAAV